MKFFRILIFLPWLVYISPGQPVELPKGRLLYSGLTETGWQVFELNLPGRKPRQLTTSPGDKREPMFVSSLGQILFRDVEGRVCALTSFGMEQPLVAGEHAYANVSFFADGLSFAATHLASNSYRRQYIYRVETKTGSESLLAAPDRGSFRTVRVSSQGDRLVCTQILKYGEERLTVLDVLEPAKLRYFSPENSSAAHPCWSADGKAIFFSMENSKNGSSDLYQVCLDRPDQLLQLTDTAQIDEYAAFPAKDGRWLFFEKRMLGKPSLACLKLNTRAVCDLDFIREQARDPFFHQP